MGTLAPTLHRQATDANGSPLRYTECGIPANTVTATLGSLSGSNVCQACVHILKAEREGQ